MTIARNLRSVLVPVNWKFHGQAQALRNWDLWGPLVGLGFSVGAVGNGPATNCTLGPQVFMLVLAIVLSLHETKASQVFAVSPGGGQKGWAGKGGT